MTPEQRKRRAELVDQSFLRELTVDELNEKTAIEQLMDIEDEAFYRPIIDRLKKRLTSRT